MRDVDESRTIYASPTGNPLGDALTDAAPPNKPFGVPHLPLPISISLLLLFSLLSLLCKNNTFFSLTFTSSSNCNYFVSVSVYLCVFFWLLGGNGRSDDSRRCVFESQIGAVHDPLQPSSPHRFPLLRSRPVSQALHHLMCRYKEKRWDSRRMLGSGGMPSSHSATVTSLAVAIGLQEGMGGPAFAVAVVLACVVMYDATGVRLHAGRQAELLNQIVCELPPEHPVSNVRPLRDSLGHTPLQVVAGAILGCVVALLMRGSS